MTSIAPSAVVTELAAGIGFAEGPVVAPDGAVFCTSIDQARVYRVHDGALSEFAHVGGGANGAALDSDGALYIAQNGGRWAGQGPQWAPDSVGGVQRIGPNGEVSWVTRDPISPNDLCFGPDGLLYVTDPTRAPRGRLRPVDGRLWRVDPSSGDTELLLSVPWFTNGIAFGPDGGLYVAATHTANIYRCEVTDAGLTEPDEVIRMLRGGPDGMAFDCEGNLVIAALSQGDGPGTIQTWTLDGRLVDTFEPGDGESYTNLAFTANGGLVVTDASAGRLLAIEHWRVAGLPLHPFL